MSEYVKQAKDFLESCNATMKITYINGQMCSALKTHTKQ